MHVMHAGTHSSAPAMRHENVLMRLAVIPFYLLQLYESKWEKECAALVHKLNSASGRRQ